MNEPEHPWHSDGEADDGFTVNGDYAAAVAALFVAGKFDPAFYAKRIKLALYCFDEWFSISELLIVTTRA